MKFILLYSDEKEIFNLFIKSLVIICIVCVYLGYCAYIYSNVYRDNILFLHIIGLLQKHSLEIY